MADHQSSRLLLQELSGQVVWVNGGGKPVHLTLTPTHLLINSSATLPNSTGDGNYSTFGSGGGGGIDGISPAAAHGSDRDINVVSIADVVGSKVSQTKLEIYRYAKPASDSCYSCLCGGKGLRRAAHLTFSFPSEAAAQDWSAHLSCLLRDSLPESPATSPPPKRYLVLVNPVSGKGQGRAVWASVADMFSQAGLDAAVVVTTHANHAFNHVNTLPLAELLALDCIVVVAGDGLVFEVVNGIMSRGDGRGAEVLRKVPLAHVGAGTGNGLGKSTLFECGEEYSSTNAAFVALRGRPRALDLSRVETASGKVLHSFLILGWGLISDIDLLSESLRCMGEARLHAAAVYFMLKRRLYRGRLSMHVRHRAGTLLAEVGAGVAAGGVGGADGASSGLDGASSSGGGGGSFVLPPLSQALPADAASVDVDIEASSEGVGGGNRGRTSSWKGPGGDAFGWKTIESDFLLVWVLQTSHATVSMHSGPGVRLDDGLFTIFVVESMSRCEMLQLLLAIDDGQHIHHPKVQRYQCNAYRLEPKTPKGLYSLDGESVDYGPIQAAVLPGAARVMKL